VDVVRVSRREFVRKVGGVGALSLLLPIVTRIAAPTRAQAQSSPSTGNTQTGCESNSESDSDSESNALGQL